MRGSKAVMEDLRAAEAKLLHAQAAAWAIDRADIDELVRLTGSLLMLTDELLQVKYSVVSVFESTRKPIDDDENPHYC